MRDVLCKLEEAKGSKADRMKGAFKQGAEKFARTRLLSLLKLAAADIEKAGPDDELPTDDLYWALTKFIDRK